MIINPLILALGIVFLFSASVFFYSYKYSKQVLAVLVGVSAALVVVQIGGVHLFTIAVLFYVAFSGVNREGALGRSVVLVASAGLMASTAWIGALTKTTDPAVQLMVLATCAALFILRSDNESIKLAKMGLLAFVSLSAAVAVLQAAGLVSNELLAIEGNTEAHRPSGLYPEPDWLGMYCAVGVVIAASMPELRQRWRIALVLLNMSGIVFSSARSAILALAAAIIWAGVRNLFDRSKGERPRFAPLIAVVGAGAIVALFAFPVQIDLLLSRMQAAIAGEGQVVQSRWAQLDSLVALADMAPWYGNGMSASGRVSLEYGISLGQITGGPTNGANWLLGLWGDGKVLSILIIALFIFAALFGNRLGSTILLVVLVNSLFSNAFSFPITWFAIAVAFVPKADAWVGRSTLRRVPQMLNPAKSSHGTERLLQLTRPGVSGDRIPWKDLSYGTSQ